MKLSDYVWKFLADRGAKCVFMVTGGGAMHLNDSLGRQGRLRFICNHHEQACAIAAEGYARVTGEPGVVSVTSGPGGVNALNGVYGCWMDSIPIIVISGQVKRETCKTSRGLFAMRQLGDQEADIIGMAKVITKYAVLVDDPQSIRYHLEKAWLLSQHGRPGPVWLDIPLDVQASEVDEISLNSCDAAELPVHEPQDLPKICREVLDKLRDAKRPVILAGSGIRAGKAAEEFRQVAGRLGVPVAASRTALDLLPYDHPCYAGRSGIDADRAGNFVVQNSDVLLVLGKPAEYPPGRP